MFTDSIHISPEDDLLDSRDLFNRYCHLESRHRQFSQQIGTWGLSKEEHKELRSLRRMQKLVRVDEDRSFEWRTGVPVVSDAYFTEYALAFAEDIGMPLNQWDPDELVEDIRRDCLPVDYAGHTFWAHGLA